MKVVSHGFYPAGGGMIEVTIVPGKPQRIELLEVEERRITAKISLAKLPRRIADAELAVLSERFELASTEVEEPELAGGPGNAVFVAVESRSITEIITGFGQRGVPGFKVAGAAAEEAERYLAANVPVGEHLADQLLIPMALGEGGRFRTVAPSRHTTTNIEIVKRFLDARIEVGEIDGKTEISVR
jgi:RNA 3'-terminal phosphate cyclase (ATP)